MLRAAKREGLPVTVETCPHYLHCAAEEIPDGATLFKCAPPIRSAANREALWQALREGVIDLDRHGPLAVPARHEAAGGQRSPAKRLDASMKPGAASHRSPSRCRCCGPSASGAASRSRNWRSGCPPRPRSWRA